MIWSADNLCSVIERQFDQLIHLTRHDGINDLLALGRVNPIAHPDLINLSLALWRTHQRARDKAVRMLIMLGPTAKRLRLFIPLTHIRPQVLKPLIRRGFVEIAIRQHHPRRLDPILNAHLGD